MEGAKKGPSARRAKGPRKNPPSTQHLGAAWRGLNKRPRSTTCRRRVEGSGQRALSARPPIGDAAGEPKKGHWSPYMRRVVGINRRRRPGKGSCTWHPNRRAEWAKRAKSNFSPIQKNIFAPKKGRFFPFKGFKPQRAKMFYPLKVKVLVTPNQQRFFFYP